MYTSLSLSIYIYIYIAMLIYMSAETTCSARTDRKTKKHPGVREELLQAPRGARRRRVRPPADADGRAAEGVYIHICVLSISI